MTRPRTLFSSSRQAIQRSAAPSFPCVSARMDVRFVTGSQNPESFATGANRIFCALRRCLFTIRSWTSRSSLRNSSKRFSRFCLFKNQLQRRSPQLGLRIRDFEYNIEMICAESFDGFHWKSSAFQSRSELEALPLELVRFIFATRNDHRDGPAQSMPHGTQSDSRLFCHVQRLIDISRNQRLKIVNATQQNCPRHQIVFAS